MVTGKRLHHRKPLRIAFILEFSTGLVTYGRTVNLSQSGALLECAGLAMPGRPLPHPGASAVLSLSFPLSKVITTVRYATRILHVHSNCVDVSILPFSSTRADQIRLAQLLDC